MKKLKKFIKPMLMLALVIGAVFAINGCAKQTDDDGTQTVTEATETDATVTDAGDTDDKTDTVKTDSETVKADTAKTGKPKNDSDSDKEPATQTPATTEAPTTQAPAPTTEAPTTQEPRTEEPTTAHQHTWKTVVDKDEWDEPIYEEQDVYESQFHCFWPDGTNADELADSCAKARWCGQHCVSCFPNCPDPDPRGFCALQVYDQLVDVCVGTEKVQTGTKHHAAVTHQECTTCGARK